MIAIQISWNGKSIRAARNWTIAGPEEIPENPHASMTVFEVVKQVLKSTLLRPLPISTIPPI